MRSGNNIKLPAAFVCVWNSHERIPKSCAQQRAKRAAASAADSAARSKACGGGDIDRWALGDRGSRLPRFIAGCERAFANTPGSACPVGVCRSNELGTQLSQRIHLRKRCACAAGSIAYGWASSAMDSGQRFPWLGGSSRLEPFTGTRVFFCALYVGNRFRRVCIVQDFVGLVCGSPTEDPAISIAVAGDASGIDFLPSAGDQVRRVRHLRNRFRGSRL